MATVIDGKALAAKMRVSMKERVAELQAKTGRVPGLVVIIVGNDSASHVYVNNKEKACHEVGFKSIVERLPEETSTAELLSYIERYNSDDSINGILVQLPLPKQIDEKQVLYAINPMKDVDGFHPFNVGLLNIGEEALMPCTPYGVMMMLKEYGIETAGKNAVVIGRSNIVGKPMTAMLVKANATVTVCHSRTQNIKEICQRADILVAAIGKAEYVTADFVKEGAVVIDVGMNRNAEGKLCGDVAYAEVSQKASAITPVPGGVGPMTITMLMYNTLTAFEKTI